MFDYITIDIPQEVVPQVRSISGVIGVVPERKVGLAQTTNLKVRPIPIEAKMAEFARLFTSNPFTGPISAFKFAAEADAGIERWPTGESRKVVGADIAEAEGITGKDIKVAVIDTGAVPTFQGHYLDPDSKSSVEGMPLPWDENGHGTWCATCISGNPFQTPFGLLKGIAPDCQVRIFKCLGYLLGAGTDSSVMRAMMDAYEWGADIISASLGSPYTEEPPETIPNCRAVRMLTNAGVINVWANGNDGNAPNTVGVPANEPSALSVGAIDKQGKVADFSSRGPTAQGLIKPDVVAPGVNTTSSSTGLIALMQAGRDWPGTASISGTSMACPHAAATVALGLEYAKKKGKSLTTEGIKTAMSLFGEYGASKRNDFGWGLITYPILRRFIDEKL
jgi:subtilisin family serine protease